MLLYRLLDGNKALVCWVTLVLDDAMCLSQAPLEVDGRCLVWQGDSPQRFSAVDRGAPIPYCNATHQQAVDYAPVEVCDDVSIHAKLLQPAKEIEPLVSFPDHRVFVWCPGEILCDVHTKKPEAVDPFDLSITDVEGCSWCVSPCCLL